MTRIRAATVFGVGLLTVAAPIRAATILLSCGGTELNIDTVIPAVTVHYRTGFSTQYKNGTETSSYKFTDGSETPYVSSETVRVSDAEIEFSDRTHTDRSDTDVENVIDRKTLLWHAEESGKVRDTKCTVASPPQTAR